MSGFILRRFSDLVAEGLKTDKGFKEVHLNAVGRDVSEFSRLDVSGQQVYNHLRKWRARWVRICKLKELSGAGWDEENFMITLADDHYIGHTRDHPKDAEFLNVPIQYYHQMQNIFGSGVATGRFAMGSNEPLGEAPASDPIDLDAEPAKKDSPGASHGAGSSSQKGKAEGPVLGKRKRSMAEEEGCLMTGLTDAIWGFAAAVTEAAHSEAAPGIYDAVMAVPGYSREALMFALGHLTENKATALVFIRMTDEDKELWMRTYLTRAYFL
ncbi:hypothetical protein ACP70R_009104 [Stipagrostis hirtigluma subsp. patula]